MGKYYSASFPPEDVVFSCFLAKKLTSKALFSSPPGDSSESSCFVFSGGKWNSGKSDSSSVSFPRFPVPVLCDEAFFFPVDLVVDNGIHGHSCFSDFVVVDFSSMKLSTDVDATGFLQAPDFAIPGIVVYPSTNPWASRVINGKTVFAARSGVSNSTSTFSFRAYFDYETKCSLSAGISSEQNFDKGLVTVDGVALSSFNNISGVASYVQDFTLSAGVHEFVFSYTKDGSSDANADTFYIEYLYLYPSGFVGSQSKFSDSLVVSGNFVVCNSVSYLKNSIDDAHFRRNSTYEDNTDIAIGGSIDGRFRFFPEIQKDSRIHSCFMNSFAYGSLTNLFDVTCHVPLVANDTSNNTSTIESNPRTSGVLWHLDPSEAWTAGGVVSTPNLASEFSQLFALSDWVPGNAASVLMRYTGVGNIRQFYPVNLGSQYAAKLCVSYTPPVGFTVPTPSIVFCADDLQLVDGSPVPGISGGNISGVLVGTPATLLSGILNGHNVMRCCNGGYGFSKAFNFAGYGFAVFIVSRDVSAQSQYGGIVCCSSADGGDYNHTHGFVIQQNSGYEIQQNNTSIYTKTSKSAGFSVFAAYMAPSRGKFSFFENYYEKLSASCTWTYDIKPSCLGIHSRVTNGVANGPNAATVDYAEVRVYEGGISRAQFDYVMTELCDKYGFSM